MGTLDTNSCFHALFCDLGDSSPVSASDSYDESEAVELTDCVLLNTRSISCLLPSLVILLLRSPSDAVSDDGKLYVDDTGEGGNESLLAES